MANIVTTYRDFFKVHDCDPVCPRKESRLDTEEVEPDVNRKLPEQVEEAGDDDECCPEETPEGEGRVQERQEPCTCQGRGRTKCECVETTRRAVAENVMYPRRRPLTYYAKVFKEYPFMLKMYGEHHTVGVEVEAEDLRSVYMTDYGADKKPVPSERKADAPSPVRVVSPFLYRNRPFRWNVAVEEQIPWKLSDCPLTTDQLLLCRRRPKGCQTCGCFT